MPYFPPIQQDQYPATDETQCLNIIIPAGDEFKALLAGLMVSAADVNNYADPSSAAADGLAAIWDQAYSEIDWSGCVPPTAEGLMSNMTLWARFARTNFTFSNQFNVNQPFAHYIQAPTVGLVNQYFAWDVYLSAGSWNMEVLSVRQGNSAIMSMGYINNTTGIETVAGTHDLNGGFLLNVSATCSFTLTEGRSYTIFCQAKTKAGGSGGYLMGVTGVNLWRSI